MDFPGIAKAPQAAMSEHNDGGARISADLSGFAYYKCRFDQAAEAYTKNNRNYAISVTCCDS